MIRYKTTIGNRLATVVVATIVCAALNPSRTFAQDRQPADTQTLASIAEANSIVDKYYAGKPDEKKILSAVVQGMLRVLDPHSRYLDQNEWDVRMSELKAEFYGLGFFLVDDRGRWFVGTAFPNSPAERIGLRYGDEIIEVDDAPVSGKGFFEVLGKLRGARGTMVRLSVHRPGEPGFHVLEALRELVVNPSITNAYLIAPGVGYIQHDTGFSETTYSELERALASLRADGMRSIIIDLRGNTGGLLKQAVRVASMFLLDGQEVVTERSRTKIDRIIATSGGSGEMAVIFLVDRNTVSAGEVLVGALQDHDRALVLGERTFGKGMVQHVHYLGPGVGGLFLTFSRFYTPSGRCIQRDYMNTSTSEYFLHRESEGVTIQPRPNFRTDAGRQVLAAGGITPDVLVTRSPDNRTRKRKEWSSALLHFTADVINGQIKDLGRFKVKQSITSHRLKPNELLITDKYLSSFKQYLASHSEFHLEARRVDPDTEFLKIELRRELIMANYGLSTAAQIDQEFDPLIRQALSQISKAAEMANAFRQRATHSLPTPK